MANPWENFSQQKLQKVFEEKKTIIDIGGGLRIDENKNNRIDKKNV